MASDGIIIPPFVGEFGWFIIRTIREVDKHPAKHKVVCCRFERRGRNHILGYLDKCYAI